MKVRAAVIALALTASALVGCVERTLLIRSDPPGAPAWVDEQYVGLTPVSFPFRFYGRRRVRVGPLRDGPAETTPGEPPRQNAPIRFREVERIISLRVPWYQVFPIDFVAEVLVPFTITDRQETSFTLPPVPEERTDLGAEAEERLMQRARALRERALEDVQPQPTDPD